MFCWTFPSTLPFHSLLFIQRHHWWPCELCAVQTREDGADSWPVHDYCVRWQTQLCPRPILHHYQPHKWRDSRVCRSQHHGKFSCFLSPPKDQNEIHDGTKWWTSPSCHSAMRCEKEKQRSWIPRFYVPWIWTSRRTPCASLWLRLQTTAASSAAAVTGRAPRGGRLVTRPRWLTLQWRILQMVLFPCHSEDWNGQQRC